MKMLSWLKESNRLSHIKIGFVIWVLLMLLTAAILSFFDGSAGFSYAQSLSIAVTSSIISDAVVFICMCSVEYIQKSSGIGKWDWLDVLAGCLVPLILTILIILITL